MAGGTGDGVVTGGGVGADAVVACTFVAGAAGGGALDWQARSEIEARMITRHIRGNLFIVFSFESTLHFPAWLLLSGEILTKSSPV